MRDRVFADDWDDAVALGCTDDREYWDPEYRGVDDDEPEGFDELTGTCDTRLLLLGAAGSYMSCMRRFLHCGRPALKALSLTLKPGKERSLLRRHPWVYESAIAYTGCRAASGETVKIESSAGELLGLAAYSPSSKIKARVWTFDKDETVDSEFFIRNIAAACRARSRMAIASDGRRLIHGESDNLPGLVVDQYADLLVAQFLSAGTERWKQIIADALLQQTGCTRLYERSDASVRKLEGLEPVKGWLRGGGDTLVTIVEHDIRLQLDVATGHKTGFYLDQRDSRQCFAQDCARLKPRRLLNCYCYTGGFTVAALAAMHKSQALSPDLHFIGIDSSEPAIAQARLNLALNGLAKAAQAEWHVADVNAKLRQYLDQGMRFDAIVLDPPKLAPTPSHVARAARAYKDINRLACKLLSPGGLFYTYSCSGGIGVELFHKIVASAAADAGVDALILDRLGSAPDHPMSTAFPEGEYLKGRLSLV
eukprot:g14990.t1